MIGAALLGGGGWETNAQTTKTVRRIGTSGTGPQPSAGEIEQAWASMRDLGWVAG